MEDYLKFFNPPPKLNVKQSFNRKLLDDVKQRQPRDAELKYCFLNCRKLTKGISFKVYQSQIEPDYHIDMDQVHFGESVIKGF